MNTVISLPLAPTPYPLPRLHHGVHQEHFAVVMEVPWRTGSVSICEDTSVLYYIVYFYLVLWITIFNVTTGTLGTGVA
jgi:hypothetical protein